MDNLKTTIKEHGINGLSLETIQKRATPLLDRTSDPLWKFRSFEGFIGPEENFLDIIEKDWKSLEELKTNQKEIALILKELLQKVENIRHEKQYGEMKPINLSFTANIGAKEPQNLTVVRSIFNGPQHSLFFNEAISKSEENTTWNEEYTIKNEKLNISILIGGNANAGVIHFIYRHCFFEGGGARNKYRVEPYILHAVLTGKCNEKTIEAVLEREKLKEEEFVEEINKMNYFKEIASKDYEKALAEQNESQLKRIQEDKQMISTRIQQLEANIQVCVQERESIASHLKKFLSK